MARKSYHGNGWMTHQVKRKVFDALHGRRSVVSSEQSPLEKSADYAFEPA